MSVTSKKYSLTDDCTSLEKIKKSYSKPKKIFNDKIFQVINLSSKRVNGISLNNTTTHNYVNINLNSKIPTVSTILPRANKSDIGHATYNSVNKSKKSSSIRKKTHYKVIDSKRAGSKTKNSKSKTKSPVIGKGTLEKTDCLNNTPHKALHRNISLQEKLNDKNTSKSSIYTNMQKGSRDLEIRRLLSKENFLTTNKNTTPKDRETNLINNLFKTNMATKEKLAEILKDKKVNDSISLSAVTYNNEHFLNSSELDIMENVLFLDGINKPPVKVIDKIPKYPDNNINTTNNYFSQQYIKNSAKYGSLGAKLDTNYIYNDDYDTFLKSINKTEIGKEVIAKGNEEMNKSAVGKHRKNYFSIDISNYHNIENKEEKDTFQKALCAMKELTASSEKKEAKSIVQDLFDVFKKKSI